MSKDEPEVCKCDHTAENDAPVQYGVELLVPHINAGEVVWFPDLWYAERSLTPGLGRLVTRVIPPGSTAAPTGDPT